MKSIIFTAILFLGTLNIYAQPWPKSYPSGSWGFSIGAFEVSDSGLISVGNEAVGTSGNISGNIRIIKTECNGSIIWSKIIPNAEARKVIHTSDDGFLIGGTLAGTINTTLVVKLNSCGDMLWYQLLPTPNYNCTYVYGLSESLNETYNVLTNYDSLFQPVLTHLDKNGNILWRKGNYGLSLSLNLLQLLNGDYLITGSGRSQGVEQGEVIMHLDSSGDKKNVILLTLDKHILIRTNILNLGDSLYKAICYDSTGNSFCTLDTGFNAVSSVPVNSDSGSLMQLYLTLDSTILSICNYERDSQWVHISDKFRMFRFDLSGNTLQDVTFPNNFAHRPGWGYTTVSETQNHKYLLAGSRSNYYSAGYPSLFLFDNLLQPDTENITGLNYGLNCNIRNNPTIITIPAAVVTTGIHSNDLTAIKVYPNPFHNLISVESPVNPVKTIELIDYIGKSILFQNVNSTDNSINLDNINTGIYFLRVTDCKNFQSIFKLAKE